MPSEEKKTICPMCNKVVIKLVPLYDHDQKHKLTMQCVHCKRRIKSGEQIIKFRRSESVYSDLEAELNRIAGKREVVEVK